MLNHLLLFRIALLNVAFLAGLVWAFHAGYVVPVFVGDVTYISYGIAALFAVGMSSVCWRAWRVGGAIDMLKAGTARAYVERRAAKMFAKNEHVADIVNWLFLLGLLGTVVGLYMGIGAMSKDNTAGILEGMRVAIGTTIVGTILGFWLDITRRMLDTATANLAEDME